MQLQFEKWHGCRNDFIIVWVNPTQDDVVNSLRRRAVDLCRRDGSAIGADGIIILHRSAHHQLEVAKLTIINSDGSIAQTCGNGIRCAAQSILLRQREEGGHGDVQEGMTFEVGGRDVHCRFLSPGDLVKTSELPLVAVTMGTTKVNERSGFQDEAVKAVGLLSDQVPWLSLVNEVGTCDIGNQHIVLYLDEEPTREQLLEVGPPLQSMGSWDGINVHLAASVAMERKSATALGRYLGGVPEDHYVARCWERGAGETNACGSGASAIAACQMESGMAEYDAWVGVTMPGGTLVIQQADIEDDIVLAGPAMRVFVGTIIF